MAFCSCPRRSGWLLLVLLLQGIRNEVYLTQNPRVVVSELGQNVTLDCQLFPDHSVVRTILYWFHGEHNALYPFPLPEYKNRVMVLDPGPNSTNKSILFLDIEWEDSRTYYCMLTVTTASSFYRKIGNGVTLFIHGPMTLELASGSEKSLLCYVNVSTNSNFYLTVFRDGMEVHRVTNNTASRTAMLSVDVPLGDGQEFECRLELTTNLSSTLILTQTFTQTNMQEFPEPVLLYVIILLIPVIIFLIQITIMLKRQIKIC